VACALKLGYPLADLESDLIRSFRNQPLDLCVLDFLRGTAAIANEKDAAR
jgi:hypothetical protein